MLVVEDLHWAEPTLLDLIEHLADWSRDAQLLLLCLARPELLDMRRAWGRSNGETITLEPLAESEADALIESLLGGSRLEEVARARIRQVAGGNPLFVEQLLATLVEGSETDRVPSTIQALLAARLDALPAEERDLLERAAVVGLDFEWVALAELAPDRRRPSGTQLAALMRKELIRPHETIEDTFRFRHMLIRDAAYERIPKELRSDLHERFAGWLDGRAEEFEEIVGYHLEQAYRCVLDLGPPGPERWRSPSGPRSALPPRAGERTPAATCPRRRTSSGEPPPCSLRTTGCACSSCLPSVERCSSGARWSARIPCFRKQSRVGAQWASLDWPPTPPSH